LLGEKLLYRDRAQFYSQNVRAPVGQPTEIHALATQRHEDSLPWREFQVGVVTGQIGVDLAFMKADLVRFPTLMPEFRLHVLSLLVPPPR
jgi:hypothetical protein